LREPVVSAGGGVQFSRVGFAIGTGRTGGATKIAAAFPAGQFSSHKSVFFFVFVRSFEIHAGAQVVFRWLSENSSKADMSDASGEVRYVPQADFR
jgi:hypothetical protein